MVDTSKKLHSMVSYMFVREILRQTWTIPFVPSRSFLRAYSTAGKRQSTHPHTSGHAHTLCVCVYYTFLVLTCSAPERDKTVTATRACQRNAGMENNQSGTSVPVPFTSILPFSSVVVAAIPILRIAPNLSLALKGSTGFYHLLSRQAFVTRSRERDDMSLGPIMQARRQEAEWSRSQAFPTCPRSPPNFLDQLGQERSLFPYQLEYRT